MFRAEKKSLKELTHVSLHVQFFLTCSFKQGKTLDSLQQQSTGGWFGQVRCLRGRKKNGEGGRNPSSCSDLGLDLVRGRRARFYSFTVGSAYKSNPLIKQKVSGSTKLT